jgi:hypothetical protein
MESGQESDPGPGTVPEWSEAPPSEGKPPVRSQAKAAVVPPGGGPGVNLRPTIQVRKSFSWRVTLGNNSWESTLGGGSRPEEVQSDWPEAHATTRTLSLGFFLFVFLLFVCIPLVLVFLIWMTYVSN